MSLTACGLALPPEAFITWPTNQPELWAGALPAASTLIPRASCKGAPKFSNMRLGDVGPSMGIVYRREIDGLRAVAVVPVVLFHAGFPHLSGGFIGVDVFFVISGFLITSIILTERAAGRFTLIGFYERRVRRILPALFTVLIVSMVAAWFCLIPDLFKNFGKSVAATTAFGSNFLFWRQSGYFAPAAADIPCSTRGASRLRNSTISCFPSL